MGQPSIPAACYDCKHFYGIHLVLDERNTEVGMEQEATVNCNAFPNGIPEAIQDGKHQHRRPHRGDGGIRFDRAEV